MVKIKNKVYILDGGNLVKVIRESVELKGLPIQVDGGLGLDQAKNAMGTGEYKKLIVDPFNFFQSKQSGDLVEFMESLMRQGSNVVAYSTQNQEALQNFMGLEQGVHYSKHIQKPTSGELSELVE